MSSVDSRQRYQVPLKEHSEFLGSVTVSAGFGASIAAAMSAFSSSMESVFSSGDRGTNCVAEMGLLKAVLQAGG